MVRAITGTLIDVGLGKNTIKDFELIIKSKDRRNAGKSVPAKGLYLTNIVYPYTLKSIYE
jgi:tRNA pseudouridine38-40 synthase